MKELKEGLLIFLNGKNYDKISELISDSLEYDGYKRPCSIPDEMIFSCMDIEYALCELIFEGNIVLVLQAEPKMWETIINKYHYNVKDKNVFCIAWADDRYDLRQSIYNLNYSRFNVISKDENYIVNSIADYIKYNILPENIE